MLVVVLVAGLALGGCGIPQESKPRVINDRDVPFALLEQSTSTTRP